MLASLPTKTWGWRKELMKRVFTTLQTSVMDFAAAARQPWLSKIRLQRLETAQKGTLRMVSGQYKLTPVEAEQGQKQNGLFSSHIDRTNWNMVQENNEQDIEHR